MSSIENQESKEFSGPSDLTQMDRRDFMKYLGLFSSMSALASCSRKADKIVPYVNEVKEFVDKNYAYYTSVYHASGFAQGILVKSYQGRPVKIEGNVAHQFSHGATNAQAQAMLYDLYHPERNRGYIWDKKKIDLPGLRAEILKMTGTWNKGKGVAFVVPPDHSPSVKRIITSLKEKYPASHWVTVAPWKKDEFTTYDLKASEMIVSFDEELFDKRPDSLKLADDFMQRRLAGIKKNDPTELNRLFVYESSPTLTGAKADRIFRKRSDEVWNKAIELFRVLNGEEVADKDILALAQELRKKKGLVVLGEKLHPDAKKLEATFAKVLSSDLSSSQSFTVSDTISSDEIKSLIASGNIHTVFLLESDVCYWDQEWHKLLKHIPKRISLSLFPSETHQFSTVQLAARHSLESWGDLEDVAKDVLIQQPLIEPLFTSLSTLQLLSLLNGESEDELSIVQKTYQTKWQNDFKVQWENFLRTGILKTQSSPVKLSENSSSFKPKKVEKPWLLKVTTDPSIEYGQFANNPLLHQLPQHFSKTTWNNSFSISELDAESLGVTYGDVLRVKTNHGTLELPVWKSSLIPQGMIITTLGYGQVEGTKIARKRGVNAYPFQNAEVVSVEKTKKHRDLAFTQREKHVEASRFVQTAVLPLQKKAPEKKIASFYPEHPIPPQELGPQWGMTIDLTTCIGCEACVSACQVENNIPFVGEEQIKKDRNMHWIRIDTYITGEEVTFQPVPCMHCEKAPCEVVCPVNATVHGNGGLNEMIYNRCVGTRYCSNNCPYKVRRFNFRAYSVLKDPWPLGMNPEVSMRDRGVMEKCTYCVQRIKEGERKGSEVKTACQQVCPTRAIEFSDLQKKDSIVVQNKSHARNFDLLEEEGTIPRTSYLKLIRIGDESKA